MAGLLGSLNGLGGLLGNAVQYLAYGPNWRDEVAQNKNALQLQQLQLQGLLGARAQAQEDATTGQKFGALLGGYNPGNVDAQAYNAQNAGDPLQMVTTQARRMTPDAMALQGLAATPSGARVMEGNPMLKAMMTPQKLGPGDVVASPMGGTLMANQPLPKRQNLPEGMMYDASGNPVPVPGYEQMRARIAAAGRAPAAPQFSSTILDNGNIGAFDTRTGRVIDTGQRATRPPSPQAQASADKQTAWNMYREARDGLIAGLSGSNTGPVAGRVPAITSAQQVAEGGVSAMAPVLKQLFRVSGEGTFTDRDQALLLEMVPTRMDNPAARDAKIANIDRIVRAKLGIPADTPTSPGGAAPADPLAGIASYMQKYGGR